MDHPLVKIVETGNLQKLKRYVKTDGILFDYQRIDYFALKKATEIADEEMVFYLLEKNCRVEYVQENNSSKHSSPIHIAVKKMCSKSLIIKLIGRGAVLTNLNEQGYSPLHLALIFNRLDIVDIMLDHIVKTKNYANAISFNGFSHFHVACTTNNGNAIEGFIMYGANMHEMISMDSDYRPGYTPRHFAAEFQSKEAIRILIEKTGLERGNRKDKYGRTAEQLVRNRMEDLSVMMYLSLGGNNSESNGQPRLTHLHLDYIESDPKIIKKFIDSGVFLENYVSKMITLFAGYTPLVKSNSEQSDELLLEEDASAEIKDIDVEPLHISLRNAPPERRSEIIRNFIYRSLTAKRQMTKKVDRKGLNYFHAAITRNDLSLVEYLLDQGEDIEQKVLPIFHEFGNYRPLHFAVRYKHVGMINLLISRGAKLNTMSVDGTPLHIAVLHSSEELIELLAKNKANVNVIRKKDGRSAIHIVSQKYVKACRRSYKDDSILVNALNSLLKCAEVLLKYGANINQIDRDGSTSLHIVCNRIYLTGYLIHLFLQYGADINVKNNAGEIPFECAFHHLSPIDVKSIMVLYHHVQRLKLLKLPVRTKNDICCQKLLEECYKLDPDNECFKLSTLQYIKYQRRHEMQMLKRIYINRELSVYDFLRYNVAAASEYRENPTLLAFIDPNSNFYYRLPFYSYMIEVQIRRGIEYYKAKLNSITTDDTLSCITSSNTTNSTNSTTPSTSTSTGTTARTRK